MYVLNITGWDFLHLITGLSCLALNSGNKVGVARFTAEALRLILTYPFFSFFFCIKMIENDDRKFVLEHFRICVIDLTDLTVLLLCLKTQTIIQALH